MVAGTTAPPRPLESSLAPGLRVRGGARLRLQEARGLDPRQRAYRDDVRRRGGLLRGAHGAVRDRPAGV